MAGPAHYHRAMVSIMLRVWVPLSWIMFYDNTEARITQGVMGAAAQHRQQMWTVSKHTRNNFTIGYAVFVVPLEAFIVSAARLGWK